MQMISGASAVNCQRFRMNWSAEEESNYIARNDRLLELNATAWGQLSLSIADLRKW
jgi:hypothetical protein